MTIDHFLVYQCLVDGDNKIDMKKGQKTSQDHIKPKTADNLSFIAVTLIYYELVLFIVSE